MSHSDNHYPITMNILGIDAGGTKTRVMYGPAEVFASPDPADLCAASFGPGNYRHLGTEGIIRLLREIVGRFGITDVGQSAVVAGFAGAGTPESEAAIQRIFRQKGFVHPQILVTSDVGLLLRALRNHGILLIAGTGSICMGRVNGRDDSTVRAGGWGHRLGDAGSGYCLGLKAIETALKIEDGVLPRTSSVLYDRVKACFNLEHLNRITDILYPDITTDHSVQERIAGLAGAVIDAARNGDEPADRIVAETANALAEYVHAVYNRLGEEVRDVGLYGGLFQHPHAGGMLIDRIVSHEILDGLTLCFEPLGLRASDPDPLIDAIRYSIECW